MNSLFNKQKKTKKDEPAATTTEKAEEKKDEKPVGKFKPRKQYPRDKTTQVLSQGSNHMISELLRYQPICNLFVQKRINPP